eukprot:TRINITY_DN4691_c0_g1_i1.p1 TRINITY_DN4691_c0_g1~~TRINITY_DN4691_c0_g1_i1.p1  ORF type:complete len:922 (+),score=327.07 TRINITY_DN4691_c0_g1_i1:36-2768(+)
MEMTSRITEKFTKEIQKRTKRSDAKYFTTKRGETTELRDDLNSSDKDRQKDAVKKIIANMTLGRDVSFLFTDVVKLSRTTNMEIKKLVYLYIMANAKLNPDEAILAVNTFVLDTQHDNPTVRALAIRTMLCVRVENMTDHCCPPLRTTLNDQSDYVRKTAALGVLKLYHTNPKLCEDQGFCADLQTLVTDSVPLVVANAVLAIGEVMDNSNFSFPVTGGLVTKLLNALSSCTEWGQVYLLDFIARYKAKPTEAESIIDRTIPRLQHGNYAVVLAAIRCIIHNLDTLTEEQRRPYFSKFTPPLVTLMSSPPEVQYITLRNIQIILQKYPNLFSLKDVRVFFCKYTDPIYVKLEKLKVLLRLFTEKSSESILREFWEYCQEVDPVFVSKSVEALGSCAIRLEQVAPRVIDILKKLAVNPQLVQPVLSASKDVLRKYPHLYNEILPLLLEQIDIEMLEDEDAKISFIWSLGEFGGQLAEAKEKLEYFTETFKEQPTNVQLAVLTATVKFFLRASTQNEGLLNEVLDKATTEDNPDLRDRAYMYWRMLSNDKHASKMSDFVIGRKPPIKIDREDDIDPSRLRELLENLDSIASVFHKPASSFVQKYGWNPAVAEDEEDDDSFDEEGRDESPTTTTPTTGYSAQPPVSEPVPEPEAQPKNDLDFLFGDTPATTTAATTPPPQVGSTLDDIFGGPAPAPTHAPRSWPVLLDPSSSNGLSVRGGFEASGGKLALQLSIGNRSGTVMNNFQLQFNTNILGIKNDTQLAVQLNPGDEVAVTVPVSFVQGHVNGANFPTRIAMRNNMGVPYYTQCEPALKDCLMPVPALTREAFMQQWRGISVDPHVYTFGAGDGQVLGYNGFSLVAQFQQQSYYSGRTVTGATILLEVNAGQQLTVAAKSDNMAYVGPWLKHQLDGVLR